MSTRWYPIYQRGGPQLRVYLPNFWLKLVKPTIEQQPNVVQFSCSMEMTKFDVQNYLEKIYNVKVIDVRTRIALGKTKPAPGKGYIIKDDDIKYAYVTLPKGEKFTFPNLFPQDTEEKQSEQSTIEQAKESMKEYLDKNKDQPNMPGWFTI